MNEFSSDMSLGMKANRDAPAPRSWRSRLPSLGLGAAAIGNLYEAVTETVAIDTMAAALEAGIHYVDTAPLYGFGLSESRIGTALSELDPGESVMISTKVGRRLEPLAKGHAASVRHGFAAAAPFEPVFDYSYDGVLRSFEQSCRRLRRDRIDILLAHDLGRETHGPAHEARYREFMEGGYRAMRELRDSGAVSAIGLGVNECEVCEQALADAEFDVILLAGRYTLLDQTALASLLPICAARNVPLIIGGPYNSGILVNGTRAGHPLHYNYAPAPEWAVQRVQRLEIACDRFGVPLAAASLQFPLAHPHVACVIPGLARREHIDTTLALAKHTIPPEFWRALREDGLLLPEVPTPGRRPASGSAVIESKTGASSFILLHADDNVLLCRRPVRAGDVLTIDGGEIVATNTVDVGHKLARYDLQPGDTVRKYGAPIGTMTRTASIGGHVHSHNMKSNYIASHTRQTVGDGVK
jgi:D-threo-aldose 1-dehydrogenase